MHSRSGSELTKYVTHPSMQFLIGIYGANFLTVGKLPSGEAGAGKVRTVVSWRETRVCLSVSVTFSSRKD